MLSGGGIPMLNTAPLGFGLSMALIDVSMLSFLKYIRRESLSVRWILIPMLVYMLQPILFYTSLHYETMIVMNLLWDVISDVLVTFLGVFLFKEAIGPYKKAGVIFSFLSIVLLSLNDGV